MFFEIASIFVLLSGLASSPARRMANGSPSVQIKRLATGDDISAEQLAKIMKLVTDKEMSDSQLGCEIRSLFESGDGGK